MTDEFKGYVRAQLAIFEAFRRLGFSPDDIYVAFYNKSELFTTVRQGSIDFNISISHGKQIDQKAYAEIWLVEAARWNSEMTDKERSEIFRSEFSESKLMELILTVKAKGMVLNAPELKVFDSFGAPIL